MTGPRHAFLAALIAAAGLASSASAQDADTLADIRGQLGALNIELEALRGELVSSGATIEAPAGNTALTRLDALEAQVQRMTSKTEELEFRINRVVTDGTNRIGDLEFRLCEIEPGCDIGALGETPSIGGVDVASQVPTPAPSQETGGPELAVSEQADFERAEAALNAGDAAGAAELFAAFARNYPGGPLTARGTLLRGQALEQTGDMPGAARTYLGAFSDAPTSQSAPEALFRLGAALGAMGQVQDACITLGEVPSRFPDSSFAAEAQSARSTLACN